jgi:excisionase family DNA binding protein
MGHAMTTTAMHTRPEIGISVREAARRIGCDPSRVRKLLKAGQLVGYRDGRRIRIRESSVIAYQDRSPVESSSSVPARAERRTDGRRVATALASLQQLGVRSTR